MKNLEEKKKIFNEELDVLLKNKYIKKYEADKVKQGYAKYYQEQLETTGREQEQELIRVNEQELEDKIDDQYSVKKEKVVERKVVAKVDKPKKVLTPEQVREKNITTILMIGVFLFLLGGIVLATNSWENMSGLMKSLSVGLISVIFYGLSWFSKNKLKINQTAYSFLILGSTFIPITILSAGYFEALGHWFSLKGSGKYYYLAVGLMLSIPIYLKHAKDLQSKLFIWISYLNISLFFAFLSAAITNNKDMFYSIVLLFNIGLLYYYHKSTKEKKESIFRKDLPYYAQGNLALSTLLLITIFNNQSTHFGFNLIVTAIAYLFVMYTSRQKHNHYVFVAVLIYGFYMLIENTNLQVVDLTLFSAIGYVFFILSTKDKEESFQKMMQYTSGIVTTLSFLFVTGKAALSNYNQESLLLALSYFLIATNYGFLHFYTKKRTFKYITPIFFVLSEYQVLKTLSKSIDYDIQSIGIFTIGIITYMLLFKFNNWKYTTELKWSSLPISMSVMLIGLANLCFEEQWRLLTLSLLIFSYTSHLINKEKKENKFNILINYFVSFSIGLSLITIYPIIIEKYTSYDLNITISGHIAFITLLMTFISILFKKYKFNNYSNSITWTLIIFYVISLGQLFEMDMEEKIMFPLYFLIGTYLFIFAAIKTKLKFFWSVASVGFITTYLVFLEFSIQVKENVEAIGITLASAILLFLVYEGRKRSFPFVNYVFWVAQVYIFLTTPLYIAGFDDKVITFVILGLQVFYSFKFVEKKALKTIYLYLSLSYIILNVTMFLNYLQEKEMLQQFELSYLTFFISSIIFYALWHRFVAWKKKLMFYIVPFNILGILTFALSEDFTNNINVILSIIFYLFTIYVFYKANIKNFIAIPLIIAVVLIEKINKIYGLENINETTIYFILAIVFSIIGQLKFNKIFEEKQSEKLWNRKIDIYSITSIFYLFVIYQNYYNQLLEKNMFTALLPHILLTSWLFANIKRVDVEFKKALETISYLSILLSYHTVLHFVHVPQLFNMEVKLLPFIALTVFLGNRTWKEKESMMKKIEWVVVIFVGALLMQDAMNSHTIYDAYIMGILSLSAIVFGFIYRIKSYFLTGTVILFLNVLIQTRPLWGSMPWWAYLIISGSVLIGVGSYNEWRKQKGSPEGKKTIKEKALESWKTWK